MAQQQKVGSVHTAVKVTGSTLRVTYHATDVVSVDQDRIVLDTGGYFTSTTKTRMNQASNQYNLGFQVYAKKGEWYVDFQGKTIKFQGNSVELSR